MPTKRRAKALKENARRSASAQAPADKPSPRDFRMLILALALGVASFAAYSNAFQAELVMDSSVLVKQDPRIREATSENIGNIFHRSYWWPSTESDLYRPVTTLSFLLNYSTLGNQDRPSGYHAINVLLHWMNACLVLVIVRRLAGHQLAPAAIAAGLFALHPVNTEAVTYIAGRADLLAALFVLLGGWCYLRAVTPSGFMKRGWLLALAMTAFAGVFAKESAVMILAFVALYDWLWRWPTVSGSNFTTRLRAAAGQFAPGYLAVAPAILTLLVVRSRLSLASPVLSHIFVDNPIVGASGWIQAKLTAIKVLGRYVSLLVYPSLLSNDYSYNQIPLVGAGGAASENVFAWISLAALVLVLGMSVLVRRRLPLVTWGVWFFVLMILPTSNLIITIGSIMAERFLYLPSIGFCVVAALGVWWAVTAIGRMLEAGTGGQRWITAALCAALFVALGARTHARNKDWQNERTLWASALAAAPDSFKVYKGSATAIWNNSRGASERDLDDAIAIAERGLAILGRTSLPIEHQDNALLTDLGQYYRLKGEFLAKQGRLDDAKPFFQKAVDVLLRARTVDRWVNEASRQLSLSAGKTEGEITDVGNFNVYVQLGASYLDLYQWANGEEAARQAMRLQPLDASGYRLAAMARFNQNRPYDAAVMYVSIVLLQPRNPDAWKELFFVFEQLGLRPPPIVERGGGPALDENQPMVRKLINDAAVAIVRQLADSGQREAATAYQLDFIDKHHVPSELFRLPR